MSISEEEKAFVEELMKKCSRPQIQDAVRICQIRGIKDVNYLFQVHEDLQHKWAHKRDMDTWE